MGNPLKKIEPWIDPIGNQGQKAIAKTTGLGADPKNPNAGLTKYDPSMKPGSHLIAPPAGGPNLAPPPGSGYQVPPTQGGGQQYTPNYFAANTPPQPPAQPPPQTSVPLAPTGGGVNRQPMPGGGTPWRGGTPPPGGPPPMMNTQPLPGNPKLAQQQQIANLLRNPNGAPMTMGLR